MRQLATLLTIAFSCAALAADDLPTMASVLEDATDADWTELEQRDLLYLFLESGVVVFELAPQFAPEHVANIKALAAEEYWDGLSILRSQDNYVVQWGDPHAGTAEARSIGEAAASLQPEFYRSRDGLSFTQIHSIDAYAEDVGFAGGFPAARDQSRAWLTHCYGMLGVGRGGAADSGSGAELYVVTGHAPRHLDRNVTLVGRAVQGMEHLSSLPRGTGALGFYEDPSEHVPIARIRIGTDLDLAEQMRLKRLRTDTRRFAELVDARRYRRESWFVDPAGRIDVCNVPLPVLAVE